MFEFKQKIVNFFFTNVLLALRGISTAEWNQSLVSTRITGGELSQPFDYPFFVTFNFPINGLCGGTLVSPDCVLTAAHCLANTKIHNVRVFVAESNSSRFGESQPVSMYIYPSKFQLSQLNMDVAIAKLSKPLKNRKLKFTNIDFDGVRENDAIRVIGWGNTGRPFQWRKRLFYEVDLMAISQAKCKRSYAGMASVTDHMFCAKGDLRIKDACLGDSGGPALRNGKQVGTVSWGYACGAGLPGVYTRLSTPEISNFLRNAIQRVCR